MGELYIDVSIADQSLTVYNSNGSPRCHYRVSTARNGAGERRDSERTPRGRHQVRAKIGTGCIANTVFRGRRPSGELYSPELKRRFPQRDWILTRIMWLSGLEPGHNRLGLVDTMRRYIYIHGAPDEDRIGEPSSHGCIKMRNIDVIALFDQIPVGTIVTIREE